MDTLEAPPLPSPPSRGTTPASTAPSTTVWRALLPLLLLLPSACGIKCYECVHNNQRVKRHNRFVYPCAEFDESDRYIMDCPDSRLCIYQRITLPLFSGSVEVTTMDGCTPNVSSQARSVEARLVKPGCIQERSTFKPPSSEYCYCDYNLCNAASLPSIPLAAPLLSLLAVLSLHRALWGT